jgi:hypothetical protein
MSHNVICDIAALLSPIVGVELPVNPQPDSALSVLDFCRFEALEVPFDERPYFARGSAVEPVDEGRFRPRFQRQEKPHSGEHAPPKTA